MQANLQSCFCSGCLKLYNKMAFEQQQILDSYVNHIPSFLSPPDAVLQVCNILCAGREQLIYYRNERILNLPQGYSLSTNTPNPDLIIAGNELTIFHITLKFL